MENNGQTAAAKAILRDLLNAVSEGMDVASTVEQIPHKLAGLGGAVNNVVDKYGLTSGMVAALAVMAEDVELHAPVDIDYAEIEKKIAFELKGSMTGRSMQLNRNLTVIVEGGLEGWAQANAIYTMVSDQAREGIDEYFLEHGVLPPDNDPAKPTSSKMLLAMLMSRVEEHDVEEPALMAAQVGMLAFLTLVRHSDELVAQDAPQHTDLANLHAATVDTARNAPEVPMQQFPTKPAYISNPDFRMEGAQTGRVSTADPNRSNEPKEAPPFQSNPTMAAEAAAPTVEQTAYCVKCKVNGPVKDGEVNTMGNGRPQLQGKCPTCGTRVSKFLKAAKA